RAPRNTPEELKGYRVSSEHDAPADLDLPRQIELAGHLAEVAAGRVGSRAAECRVIERIEPFDAHLEIDSFGDLRVLQNAQIDIVDAVGAHVADARRECADVGSELFGRGAFEGRSVEPAVDIRVAQADRAAVVNHVAPI